MELHVSRCSVCAIIVELKAKLSRNTAIFALRLLKLDHLFRMKTLRAICMRLKAGLYLLNWLSLLLLRTLNGSKRPTTSLVSTLSYQWL